MSTSMRPELPSLVLLSAPPRSQRPASADGYSDSDSALHNAATAEASMTLRLTALHEALGSLIVEIADAADAFECSTQTLHYLDDAASADVHAKEESIDRMFEAALARAKELELADPTHNHDFQQAIDSAAWEKSRMQFAVDYERPVIQLLADAMHHLDEVLKEHREKSVRALMERRLAVQEQREQRERRE